MRLGHLVAVLLIASADANSVQVPPQRGDACGAVWEIGAALAQPRKAPGRPWELECADGDPRCDRDGEENGRCLVTLDACLASAMPGCQPSGVRKVRVPRKTRQAVAGLVAPISPSSCGSGTIGVDVGRTRAPLALVSLMERGRSWNNLRVRCLAPGTCVDCCLLGRECTREAPGLPRSAMLRIAARGSDLDVGANGSGHDFTLTHDWRVGLCLSNCDATSDPVCDATTSCPAAAGTVLAPPQPMLANGVPVCIVHRQSAASASGTIDLATGAMTFPVALTSDVYVQTADINGDNVCPRCDGTSLGAAGTCEAGSRQGRPCIVDGTAKVVGSGPSSKPMEQRETYHLSTQCPPDENKLAISMPLATMVTTGEATTPLPCAGQREDDACSSGTCSVDCGDRVFARGGVAQVCCSSNRSPCFPAGAVRRGTAVPPTPAWPAAEYPKRATGGVLAGFTCASDTNDATLDLTYGLPGPVAVLVPVEIEIWGQP